MLVWKTDYHQSSTTNRLWTSQLVKGVVKLIIWLLICNIWLGTVVSYFNWNVFVISDRYTYTCGFTASLLVYLSSDMLRKCKHYCDINMNKTLPLISCNDFIIGSSCSCIISHSIDTFLKIVYQKSGTPLTLGSIGGLKSIRNILKTMLKECILFSSVNKSSVGDAC